MIGSDWLIALLKFSIIDSILDLISIVTISALLIILLNKSLTLIYSSQQNKQFNIAIKSETVNKFVEKYLYKKKLIILYLIGIIWAIKGILPYTPYGSEQIGSLIEKKQYQAVYYLEVYPEDEAANISRTRGMIKANVNKEKGREYFLVNVSLGARETLSFDTNNKLQIDKKVLLTDIKGKKWIVKLSNRRFPFEKLK
jgi:hypothetical protein